MIVTITAEAEADLEQIATYVAEQSPRSALELVRELRERCESLVDAPRGYFGRFLIFHRVGTDAIEVIHILHGARDYEPLLFPEE